MIMKLSDIKNGNLSAEWAEKGYELPKFDIEAVKTKTHAEPTWVHFGAGTIFRAFPAATLHSLTRLAISWLYCPPKSNTIISSLSMYISFVAFYYL